MKKTLVSSLILFTAFAWGRSYTTNFPVVENPLSEGGNWSNGATTGLDWNDMQSSGAFAGGVPPSSVLYSDPTAIVNGTWGPDQKVTATVRIANPNANYYQEVELRLRTSIAPHSITGYEIIFGVSHPYVQVVRWNGPRANFTYVGSSCTYPSICGQVDGFRVANGDTIQATITGTTINVYDNGALIATATDSTFSQGSPGIGVNAGCGSTYGDFGFTSFTATDGGGVGTPPPSGPISFVQAFAQRTGSASSFSVSLPANTNSGDLILVGIAFGVDASVTVTDSQGNNLTEVGSQLNAPGGVRSRVYYAPNIRGGPETVTVTLSATSNWIELYLTEYAAVDPANPIDGQAGAVGYAGNVSSGNVATTVAGDMIYGYCQGAAACMVGSGFAARSTFDNNLVEDQLAGNPGPYAATGTANSGWAMQMVALRPAAPGSVPPVITSATTATGTVGTAFSYQITASNSPTSYDATGLPAGLTVNTATGLVSGTPTSAGTFTVTLSATNSGGTGTATLTITIAASSGAPPTITSATTATGTVGAAFSYQITASNSPSSYGATGLPAGLTVNAATGLVSGTPSAAGTFTVTLSATNSAGTGTATLTVTIAANATAISFVQAFAQRTGSASSFSVSLPANTNTGDLVLIGIAFAVDAAVTVTDSQGNNLTEVGTQLTAPGGARTRVYYASNIAGGPETVTVTLSATSNWIELYLTEYAAVDRVNPIDGQAGAVGGAGNVSSGNVATTVAGDMIYGYCQGTAACTVGSGFTARSTFDNNLVEDQLAGNPGSYAATGTANSGWAMQMVALRPAAPGSVPPAVTSATTATGTVGTAFSYQITASSWPTSYGAMGLPAGLTVDTATGLVSGTPTAAGTFPVTLSATNSAGTGTATLTITIAASGKPISFVQAFVQRTGSSSSLSVSLPANTNTGDLVLIGIAFAVDAAVTVTDSQGNNLTEVGTQLTAPGGARTRVYYASNIAGGPETVTVTLSATSSWIELYLTEYAAVDPANPIDGQAGAVGGAGNVSSGNVATTVAGDMIYGYCQGTAACTVGSGFTARSTFDNNLVEDQLAGNPGPYAATGTANSGWAMQMVALKPASPGN